MSSYPRNFKQVFLLIFIACCLPLSADRIDEQLQMILPGTDQESLEDRQYVETMIRQLITELESDRIEGKSYRRQLIWIQQRLDGGFFETYDLTAGIEDIFKEKRYNDATASIAYAMLLDHFAIPYVGLVNHWEAYLLVDPSGRSRTLRAPQGESRTTAKELAFRQDYVELLNLTILPAQRPVGQEAADSLFYRFHYTPRQPLSFDELAAYYHYQNSLNAYQTGNHLEVIQSLNIARQMDERPAFGMLEQAAYLQLAKPQEGAEGEAALYYLFELWHKDPDNEYIPRALLSHFADKTEELVQIASGFASAEQLYLHLHSRAADFPQWQRQLQELYYFQQGRYADKKGRDDLVLNYMDSLYRMRPDVNFYQEAISSLSLRLIRAEKLEGSALSRRLDAVINRYPFMANHPVIGDLTLSDLARKVRAHFVADEAFAGEQLLVEFRRSLSNFNESPQREIWILEAYLAASYFYFLQADYARARVLVNEALRHAPSNEYLLHQQELLSNY